MTRELQSTLEASGIEWPTLRNHIPCMAHVIQLALGALMSSLGVKGRTKSWEAHERNQQFGENESIHVGKSQRVQKEGNARINKVSAMKPGLRKIIEKVRISWYFESPEADVHIAENAWYIDYGNTWSPKRVYSLSKSQSPHCSTSDYGCEDTVELYTGVSRAPTVYGNSHAGAFKTQNTVDTGRYSQLRMNGRLSSMSWKYWGHFDIGPFGCRRAIQSHCIPLSQYKMTCSITWMTWCELWPRRRLNGRKTCSSRWSSHNRSFPNTTLK